MSQPPQPPYSGQPYSGQPSSGQPYSGQPYQGGQYPGQNYPSQPYSGQPNPDVPSSVPPGYPPTTAYPSSGQPEYGQPYGTPQPDYAQQGFGQPGFPPATPPKKKSKALPIILTVVAIVLVVCVGGVVALFMVGKNAADDIENQINALPTTGSSGQATEPTKAVSSIKITEPKTLGGRPKLTDPQFAGVAEELQSSLKGVPGATNSVGALYGTVEKQDIVIVAAAEAPLDDPEKELDQTFLGAGIGGLKISNITDASTGELGGSAKCGSAETSGIDMAICSWADEGSLGMVIWYFKSVSKAKSEFPKLRAQIETKA